MPWTAKQHRLFEAAAHDPSVARRVGIPQGKAAHMASEGIKRRKGGLAYADGGNVKRTVQQHPYLTAGGGLAALAAAAAALAPGRVNRIARPIQRMLTKPTFATEAISADPLDKLRSDYRFGLALSQARGAGHDELAQLPVEEGQGAWLTDSGDLQTNPLYMQQLPRTIGRVDRDTDALGYAADMGRLLDQQAVPVARGIPDLIDTPEGSNAVLAKGVDKGALATLAKGLGDRAVVAHQPDERALMFPLPGTDLSLEALRQRAAMLAPAVKLRYGVSDPGIDRVLIGDVPYADMPYSEFGENPRTPAYSALERMLMNSDAPERDFQRLSPQEEGDTFGWTPNSQVWNRRPGTGY